MATKNNKENKLFLDLHVLQSLPPSNINRDDSGSPKSALFGGVRRSRVSSQSWKKAMRDYLEEDLDVKLGIRTRHIHHLLREELVNRGVDDAEELSASFAEKILGVQIKLPSPDEENEEEEAKDETSGILGFYTDAQITTMADIIQENPKFHTTVKTQLSKLQKETLDRINENPSADIALFGRMVAKTPYLSQDASAQVAHAISTHKIQSEFDFYTAMDDLQAEGESGAAMMGSIEYGSSTLYRYANVGLHLLEEQTGGAESALDTALLFVKGFVQSLPQGMITSFAHQTLPAFVLVTLRTDRPVSLVSAYETPVSGNKGHMLPSIQALIEEANGVEAFVPAPRETFYLSRRPLPVNIDGTQAKNMEDLTDKIAKAIRG